MTVPDPKLELIFNLLDAADERLEKRALQQLCEIIEKGLILTKEQKIKIFRWISKLLTSNDILVRRWLYKTIGLLKAKHYLPFLKGQLKEHETDPENRTWIIAALYAIEESDKVSKLIIGLEFNKPLIELSAGYFERSFLPKEKKQLSKLLDSNDPLGLKWFSLLYGNSLDNFLIDGDNLKDLITRLNLHDDNKVVEYSIWAIYKSLLGRFADSQIYPQDISKSPPNVRRWLYRLLTKDLVTINVYYDVIESACNNENDVYAREGLAIGLGIFGTEEMVVPLLTSWFQKEKNSIVRMQLLKSISENAEKITDYQKILKVEIENPFDQVSKSIAEQSIKKIKPVIFTQSSFNFMPTVRLEDMQFSVAVSFPGEKRVYVKETVEELCKIISKEKIFYDDFFKAQLAKPGIDIVLENIYHKQTKLNVIFVCEDYENKEWCGVEFRAIRDLIKQKKFDQIMLMAFDDYPITGLFSIDGKINLKTLNSKEAADLIISRLNTMI